MMRKGWTVRAAAGMLLVCSAGAGTRGAWAVKPREARVTAHSNVPMLHVDKREVDDAGEAEVAVGVPVGVVVASGSDGE